MVRTILAAVLVMAPLAPGSWVPDSRAEARTNVAAVPSAALFVPNSGQFSPGARYRASGSSGTLWVADDALWLTAVRGERPSRTSPDPKLARRLATAGVNLRLTFVGANASARREPVERQGAQMN